MDYNYSNCPNCNAAIKKEGVFGINNIVSANKTEVVNLMLNRSVQSYCDRCYDQNTAEVARNFYQQSNDVSKTVEIGLTNVPVITLQHPNNWEYTVIRMVTAQYVTGEGGITEFSNGWNDIWGMQSFRMKRKLKAGEDTCMAKLRMEVINAGGNAVIGVDIDYAELGGRVGMMMVCMSGTAVKLANPEIISADRPQVLIELTENVRKLNQLRSFSDLFPTFV